MARINNQEQARAFVTKEIKRYNDYVKQDKNLSDALYFIDIESYDNAYGKEFVGDLSQVCDEIERIEEMISRLDDYKAMLENLDYYIRWQNDPSKWEKF